MPGATGFAPNQPPAGGSGEGSGRGGAFCAEMLEPAPAAGPPDVLDADQGVRITATAWAERGEAVGAAVSTHGRGRLGNVPVERLWRSVKHEDAYIRGREPFEHPEKKDW